MSYGVQTHEMDITWLKSRSPQGCLPFWSGVFYGISSFCRLLAFFGSWSLRPWKPVVMPVDGHIHYFCCLSLSSTLILLSPHPLQLPFSWLSLLCFQMRTQLSALCWNGRGVKDVLLGKEQGPLIIVFLHCLQGTSQQKLVPLSCRKNWKGCRVLPLRNKLIKLIQFWIFSLPK